MNLDTKFVGFDVYFLYGECPDPVCVTLPIGPALEVCSFHKSQVIKLVPVYELPPVSEPENKE